jgi:hypothetical protein
MGKVINAPPSKACLRDKCEKLFRCNRGFSISAKLKEGEGLL